MSDGNSELTGGICWLTLAATVAMFLTPGATGDSAVVASVAVLATIAAVAVSVTVTGAVRRERRRRDRSHIKDGSV